MKRVLLLTFEFPPRVGGAENYFFELVRRMKGTEVVVLTPPHPEAEQWDVEQPFTVIRRPFLSPRIFPHWLPLFWHAFCLMRRERFDLIWAGQMLPTSIVGFFLSTLLRKPFGIHTNGMDLTVPMLNPRRRWLMERLIRSANFITTISEYTRLKLIELGADRTKIHFVYPCASLREGQKATRLSSKDFSDWVRKKGWHDRRILLTVSRLVERKGHDRVIQALSKLLLTFPNLAYVIAGDGPERGRLEQLVHSLHLEETVFFEGKVEDAELPFYFATCEVFIMPCRELQNHDVEGFGIVFLEANLFGKPVIGGRSGGVPSAIEDHRSGLLVDPNSERDQIEAITWLLTDRNFAKRLGENGKKRSQEQFNWETQALALEHIWNNE